MVERKPINDRQKRINEREAQKAAYEAQVQAYVQEELKKREKRRRAIIALCGILGAACLLYVGFYGYEDYRTRRSYEEMAGLKGEETGQSINQAFGNDAPTINYTKDDKTVPEVLDEYKKLYNTNKKQIGRAHV